MFKTLKFKELNAACYISAVTDEPAWLSLDDKGHNQFEIEKTDYVMDAYHTYRKAVDNFGKLEVDLIRFNRFREQYVGYVIERELQWKTLDDLMWKVNQTVARKIKELLLDIRLFNLEAMKHQ